ncbi:MAG TPA: hypothetical protein VGI39_32970 [Polyangiaceae bacterium]|jgi:GNAT superfamily N-acetyltransferase
MNPEHYVDAFRRYGLGRTLYDAAYRAARKVTEVAVWNGVVLTMDTLDRSFLSEPKRAAGRFADAAELKSYARDPIYDLDESFIDHAMALGDRCHVFVENGTLQSYGWYARHPTGAGRNVVLHFDPAYVYMYKGFTHPKFRGQRLHAIGMAAALEAYTNEGARGFVSYVDSANFASLRSCDRMGYHTFGRVVVWWHGRSVTTRATPGCAAYGFHVVAVS